MITIGYLRNDSVFPVIFICVKNKAKETYDAMFNLLSQLIPGLCPHVIKTDFEYSLISSIICSFTNVRVSGCLFHLSQCLLRKIQSLQLFCQYKNNFNVKKFVKALLGLSFVKISEIENTFYLLKNHLTFPSELTILYEYFYNTYIGRNISDLIKKMPIM